MQTLKEKLSNITKEASLAASLAIEIRQAKEKEEREIRELKEKLKYQQKLNEDINLFISELPKKLEEHAKDGRTSCHIEYDERFTEFGNTLETTAFYSAIKKFCEENNLKFNFNINVPFGDVGCWGRYVGCWGRLYFVNINWS